MLRQSFTWTLLAVATLAVTGCDDDDGMMTVDPGPDAGSMDPTASVRVIHLSPDAPAVDVFVNDDPAAVVSDLAFPDGTGYLEVPADTYDFDVAPTGGAPADTVLAIDGLELAADTHYTAVAFDEVASIQALPLVDDLTGVATGNIRIRAIHTAVAVGEVDIWNVTDPGNPALLYENVGFGDAGSYLDVPAGAYSIGFDVDDDMVPDLTFDMPSLPEGTVANVFAVSEGSDVFLIAQLADGTTVRLDPNAAM